MQTSCQQTARIQSRIIKELESLPEQPQWTQFEDDMIRRFYPTKGGKIAKVLGKTVNQIQKRAAKLGVRYQGGSK